MNQSSESDDDRLTLTGASPRWQFSLRDLLVVITVASLYLAAFTVVFQNLGFRTAYAGELLCVHGIAATLLVMIFRSYPKGKVGRIHVRLLRPYRPMLWFLTYGWLPLFCLIITPLFPSNSDSTGIVHVGLLAGLVYSAVFGSVSVASRSIALGENGIVYDGLWFTPWRITSSRRRLKLEEWHIDDRGVLTLGRGWLRTETFVPPEQREAIEALLTEKIEKMSESSSSDPHGRTPPHVSRRWQFTLRDLLFITTAAALHLAAFATIYQYAESNKQLRIFYFGIAGGIGALIGASISAITGRIRAGHTFVKLQSLYTRARLYTTTLLAPSVVLATYAIFLRWLAIPISDSVIVGLVTGLIISTVLSAIFLLVRSTRLCESGLVRCGIHSWLWSHIRHLGWRWDDADRLTIGKGWRKWTVIVPPEQREVVEALLLHKLGRPRR